MKIRDSKITYFALYALLIGTVSGCTSLVRDSFSDRKWVAGNTYYSQNLPDIRVKVNLDLPFTEEKHLRREHKLSRDSFVTAKSEIEKYYFKNKEQTKTLVIITNHFPLNANWFWYSFDYAKKSNILKHGSVNLLGTKYATGVYPWKSKKGTMYLIKRFGRLAGKETKFELIYSEKVGPEWANIRMLPTEKEQELRQFNQRADSSFEILPFASPSGREVATSTEPAPAENSVDSALATAVNEDTRAILEYIKHAGRGLDAETRTSLIEAALDSATNADTRKILQSMQ